MNAELREKIAQAMYHVSDGMDDETYEAVEGEPRRAWSDDKPWDSDPENTLCEWERDEYRIMAEAAFKVIMGDDSV